MSYLCALPEWHAGARLRDAKAAYCTEGFPERGRLMSGVFRLQSGPETRLIPKMNFVCNGTIVGFTAALSEGRGDESTVIQVWRGNSQSTRPDPLAEMYYKASGDVAISEAACVDGLTPVTSDVLHCDLNENAQVSVQSGDIFGLELPGTRAQAALRLYFGRVPRGPTNYVFREQMLSSTTMLADSCSLSTEIPQITVDVHPGMELTTLEPLYKDTSLIRTLLWVPAMYI